MTSMLRFFISLWVSILSTSVFANSISTDMVLEENLPLYSRVYDDQRDPFKDAQAALTLAQNTKRNVLIKVGGNWCNWCMRMDAFIKENPDVYQSLHQNFVVLKVNVSDSNENAAFMKSLPPVLGYPHIYVSTAQGKMLISKDTAELYQNDDYSKDFWLAFMAKFDVQNASSAG